MTNRTFHPTRGAEAASWRAALRDGLASGAAASLLSTAVVSLAARRRIGHAAAPTNATSQWIWGVPEGSRAHRPSLRHTATGYAIHHAMATMWATVFERMMRPAVASAATWSSDPPAPSARPASPAMPASPHSSAASGPWARAFAVAGMALVADYVLMPRRFTPGYEAHLRIPVILLAYAGFGLGLAAVALARGGGKRGRTDFSPGAGGAARTGRWPPPPPR